MTKIVIGIAYHKRGRFQNQEPYLPIQVGALMHPDLGIQKDSDGDNISAENAYCSELSATYWLWKNVCADYKGLFHYRRFMTFEKRVILKKIPKIILYYLSKFAAPFIRDSRCFYPHFDIIKINEGQEEVFLNRFYEDLQKDIQLNNTDCYSLGFIEHSTRSMSTHLNLGIGGKNYEWLIEMISKEYPDFNKYFLKTLRSGKLIGYNMIIARNELFEEYCNILFGIIFKYHQHFNNGIPNGVINNALLRSSGYVGEIITDAFIRMLQDRGYNIERLNCVFVNTAVTGMSYQEKPILKRIAEMIT